MLVRAGRLTWRYPILWPFGVLATLAGAATRLAASRWLHGGTWQRLITEPEMAVDLLGRLLQPVVLISGVALLLTATLILWLLSAAAEGGIIRAAAELDRGATAPAVAIWRSGLALVVPFILIDTVLFFPIFLLLLLALLLGGGGLIGLVFLTVQGSTPQTALTLFIAGGTCLAGLLILSAPLTLVTWIFRLVAFRGAALDGLKTVPAIRQAWRIIKYNGAHVLILVAIVWLFSFLLNGVAGVPVSLLRTGSLLRQATGAASSLLPAILFLAELLRALLHAILFVFTATLWTVAYQEFDRPAEATLHRLEVAGS